MHGYHTNACTLITYTYNHTHTRPHTADIVYGPVYCIISGNRLRNFEIRVGNDGENIGNNAVCYKQFASMEAGITKNFTWIHKLFGSWISISKSTTKARMVHLHVREVRWNGNTCKYNSVWWWHIYPWNELHLNTLRPKKMAAIFPINK